MVEKQVMTKGKQFLFIHKDPDAPCPQCEALFVKLKAAGIFKRGKIKLGNVEIYDAATIDGMAETAFCNVRGFPTLICHDAEGYEEKRLTEVESIAAYLTEKKQA
jgi:hypothetical protein